MPSIKRQALAMRVLPVSYLQYYFHQKELYEKISSQEKTRGESLIEVDKQLLKDYSDPNLTTKPAGLSLRGGAWYSEAAVSLSIPWKPTTAPFTLSACPIRWHPAL